MVRIVKLSSLPCLIDSVSCRCTLQGTHTSLWYGTTAGNISKCNVRLIESLSRTKRHTCVIPAYCIPGRALYCPLYLLLTRSSLVLRGCIGYHLSHYTLTNPTLHMPPVKPLSTTRFLLSFDRPFLQDAQSDRGAFACYPALRPARDQSYLKYTVTIKCRASCSTMLSLHS